MWNFTKQATKRGNWPTRIKLQTKNDNAQEKRIMKFKLNASGVTQETVDYGNVATASVWETPDMQSKELVKVNLLTYVRKVSVTKRCPRGNDASKKLHTKRNSKIFHYIQSAKNKMLRADLNLVDRYKTISHGTEKMLILLIVLF